VNRFLIFLLALSLAACATPPTVHVDVTDMSRSDGVQLRDVRPPDESKSQIMSLLITADAYGVIRDGDIHTEPSMLRLVQHRVSERVGPQAHVTVHHFVSYRNLQSQLRSSVLAGTFFGPIGSLIASSQYNDTIALSATLVNRNEFDGLTGDNEWKRALYSPAENPGKAAVFVTYLDLEVDDKRAFVRVVSPVKAEGDQNSFLLATEATIQEALKQLTAAPPVVAAVAPAPPTVPATPGALATPSTSAARIDGSKRPVNTRHLDVATLDGKTLTYQHVRDPEAYGDVHLRFSGDRVDASNNKSRTTGHYTVEGDKLCMSFESSHWTAFCVYVMGGAADTHILFVSTGNTLPATLQ